MAFRNNKLKKDMEIKLQSLSILALAVGEWKADHVS
jgi:hypothetical protein